MSLSRYFTTYKNLFSKAWSLIIAAEIFSGALVILSGLSSSKTSLRASSNGGIYFYRSSILKIIILYFDQLYVFHQHLLLVFVFLKNVYILYWLSFKNLALLFVSKAIKTISDSILFLTSST